MNEYDKQAKDFLDKFSINFRATLSNTRKAPFDDNLEHDHYIVTLSAPDRKSLKFDFFNSHNDTVNCVELRAYGVLACISSDQYCPDTFESFCSEYGYDQDSRKAFTTFERASKFAVRLKKFFTEEELDALIEIQ